MHGIITLRDAAARLGIETVRSDRTVRFVLLKLEAQSGHKVLVVHGEGRGRRYLVIEKVLEAILDGHLSTCAKKKKAPARRSA